MFTATIGAPISADSSAAYRRSYETITVTPSSPHIGAEIGGVDLTQPLPAEQVAEIKAAFTQFQVIFLRDQRISFEDQIRFASLFGPLGKHVGKNTISKPTENELVRRFHYDETSDRVSGENWHSDQSCAPMPPLGSMLYLHTIPPDGGGDTMFASTYAAYDALSDKMKQFLSGLTATHDGARVFGPGTPKSSHPVIVRHPESGRRGIYVSWDFTSHIDGLPKAESDAILAFLYRHIGRDEWSCRFRWQPHSIAFWDNRCAQHKAIWDYWPNVRSGFRVQIEGTQAPIAG
ncbi:TauD/TfdA family dioxygenase [Ramlibacter sp. AW1]|uniref:TauD/TfdA family dioxygenase n=1 Tax=Ramlibacter aurantiacus TaxID=2801330 RepID=A0A936ZJ05_9BURK|nr:TauD/TfdA family dioxygenase [Ramlibacter aurantiacus]MBL0421797.1 TauD/TfdA family dioxygenase [Ramlibacter aurantiacus]